MPAWARVTPPVAADFRSGTDRLTHRILLHADAGVTTAEIGGPVVALERRLREVSQHSCRLGFDNSNSTHLGSVGRHVRCQPGTVARSISWLLP